MRRRHTNSAVLLAVGRLVEQKGFAHLIRACALLGRRGYDFRCEIVGDGPLRDDLQRLALELGVSARVRLQGRKFQEELLDYFAEADVFVLPCVPASDDDRDGIPNTLIEAMALEVPVVSTRFSGIPELVTHERHGLLVEPSDVAGLADAIAYVLDHPRRAREMGEAGRDRVLQDFAIETSGARLQALFASFPLDGISQPGGPQDEMTL
jgi:glycosyltransferase involved in cell wall biosynthesis